MDILFGSVTGTAENVARNAAKMARARGHEVRITELDEISMEELAEMKDLLVVIATYGEGEMPFNAEVFWDELEVTGQTLEGLNYGVLALGDTAYEQFCQAGRDIDEKLEELGANRRIERVDCDLNYEKTAEAWIDKAIPVLDGADPMAVSAEGADPEPQKWSRANPYRAKIMENTVLSGEGSTKQINHISIDISGSELTYKSGDSIAVIPRNSDKLVQALLDRLDAKADDIIEGYDLPLGELLASKFEILTPPDDLLIGVADVIQNEEIKEAVNGQNRAKMDAYRWNRDVIDLLNVDPRLTVGAGILLTLLQPLQHRAYSIASSPEVTPDRIDLTVAAVRWQSEGRDYDGVCSTMLTDLMPAGAEVDMFMVPNKRFRLPEDADTTTIMIGPGTGIAPFIAFLEERRAKEAKGENWLFFGDRNEATDFIYRDRLEGLQADGYLHHLHTAFSRDGDEKVYVQHRMKEHGAALYAEIEKGAVVYLCGDAKTMAPDVEATLHEIISEHGEMKIDAAERYLAKARRAGRYLKDVY
ncbi:MAG: sulfite reductase flavoprotein subunit alpha [Pseudomonadota bacterium]